VHILLTEPRRMESLQDPAQRIGLVNDPWVQKKTLQKQVHECDHNKQT
jgi:hypothetical protein